MSEWQTIETGEMEGLKYEIVDNPYGGYNGYITFPKRPAKETGYRGILTYVPVHGGITYASEDKEGGFTYGFDTSHFNSEEMPREDIEWIRGQIDIMRRGILLAVELEDEYLLTPEDDLEKRADICDKIGNLQPDELMNFGVQINLLTGRL